MRGSRIWRAPTAAVEQYLEAAEAIADRGLDATISIKLSQLGQTVDRDACVANLAGSWTGRRPLGVPVEIDMEHSEPGPRTRSSVFREAATRHPQIRVWPSRRCLRRTPLDLEALAPLKPRVRLVKGAYAEPVERGAAVQEGRQRAVQAPHRLAVRVRQRPRIRHPRRRLHRLRQAGGGRGRAGKRGFEIQMLYGIRRDLQESWRATVYRVRVYIPFGSAWYPYLMRRMAERPRTCVFFLRALVGR